ncbi:MAG TPA: DUF4922 domain-containing protein, partial [Bacteroidota bacterium]|nr:DUF4922 domain-containing protein [Bacteroidota bacterium]
MPLSSERVFAVHPRNNSDVSLPTRLQRLLDEQRKSWKDLTDGFEALRTVKTRELVCGGFPVTLQFNPGRIKSTGAVLDEASLRARKCFLCVENLPVPQRGVLYSDEFLILCNPAPIFKGHFTVSHVDHREQSIEAFPGVFLDLARDLSPQFTVFYNGPKCGASAPDHLHYQVCPSNVIPIES